MMDNSSWYAGPPVDVWCLGIVTYTLLTKIYPFAHREFANGFDPCLEVLRQDNRSPSTRGFWDVVSDNLCSQHMLSDGEQPPVISDKLKKRLNSLLAYEPTKRLDFAKLPDVVDECSQHSPAPFIFASSTLYRRAFRGATRGLEADGDAAATKDDKTPFSTVETSFKPPAPLLRTSGRDAGASGGGSLITTRRVVIFSCLALGAFALLRVRHRA